MTDASLVALFVRPLNTLRIPYLVTGAVAAVVYGEPRLTRDRPERERWMARLGAASEWQQTQDFREP